MGRRIRLLLPLLLLLSLAACGSRTVASLETTDAVSTATPETEAEPTAQAPADEPASTTDSKALVAYFSRAGENYSVGVVEQGSTEIIAEMITKAAGADTFHIQTVKHYPEGYEDCKKVVLQERDEEARPELASRIEIIIHAFTTLT